MTVVMENGVVVLTGDCPVGDAEELFQHLLAEPAAAIDWRFCDNAHSAVVQVLLAAGREVLGPPKGEFLRSRVEPALTRARNRI